jgi:KDO2-lipid IV(A) lauroyltransferase
MAWKDLRPHCEFIGAEEILSTAGEGGPLRRVVAIGHFGNFELYARFGQFLPVFQCATTYRGLRQPSLNRLLQSLRERSGCLFFERRAEAAALKKAMTESNLLVGLLADQHAGRSGVRVPFFGKDCSTTVAPAVFALRYRCPLHVGICYRVGPGEWRIEAGAQIPTHQNGRPRSVEEITLEINRAFETAIRRDPANWFWVHRRWKPVAQSGPPVARPQARDLISTARPQSG